MSEFDIIQDSSLQNLKEVPPKILKMCNLRMLYLQQNFIKEIPRSLFKNLPQLTWLDLRHNHVSTIPKEIAFHKYLENLLLSDNKIQALPNELGTLPQLKVLQIANNPLSYPSGKVISEGTKGIVSYLKQQYQRTSSHGPVESTYTKEEAQNMKVLRSEKEIRVMADYVNDYFPAQESMDSSLIVKGLSKVKRQESGIIHKLSTTSPNKILIRSYYDEDDDKCIRVSTQTSDSFTFMPPYKQTWIEKLKELLDQQEKIIQQERNLQALTSWRAEKRKERPSSHDVVYRSSPPYATDPRFATMLSREDIHKEIDKMIERSKNPPRNMDVEKLIGDLVSQLKEMETTYGGLNTPRSEIEAAGAQITKIMEMHKKILGLHDANKVILQ